MPYATIADMVTRLGADELIRISTPAGQDMDGIVAPVVDAALDDASALMDSYIRRRYRTPLDTPPPEVTIHCVAMARYNLATGDGKTCAEEVRNRNDAAIRWLRDIAAGTVRLDLEEVTQTTEETAEVYIGRDAVFHFDDLVPFAGPLAVIGRAIDARLKQVMPPNRFTYRWLPAKMDKTVWELLIQRCPSVSLEFAGFVRLESTASLIGDAVFNVWLAVENKNSAEAALFGDKLGQGALTVLQVAMVALHGLAVPGAGTVLVAKAEPVALKDRDDPGIYAACLTVHIAKVGIDLAEILPADVINAGTLASEAITWSFGDNPEIVQTDTDSIVNTGTA